MFGTRTSGVLARERGPAATVRACRNGYDALESEHPDHDRKDETMLHFEGDKEIAKAPGEAYAQLSDARFLARCLPGAESLSRVEPDVLTCVLRPGFSFVRGTLEVTLRVTEATPETTIRYQVHGKGIGSSNDVEASLTLTPHEQGTHIHWVAGVTQLGGLLKAVPRGLIQAAAQKVIDDLWQAVVAQLNSVA